MDAIEAAKRTLGTVRDRKRQVKRVLFIHTVLDRVNRVISDLSVATTTALAGAAVAPALVFALSAVALVCRVVDRTFEPASRAKKEKHNWVQLDAVSLRLRRAILMADTVECYQAEMAACEFISSSSADAEVAYSSQEASHSSPPRIEGEEVQEGQI